MCSKQPDFLDNRQIHPTIPNIHGLAWKSPPSIYARKEYFSKKKKNYEPRARAGTYIGTGFRKVPRSDPAGAAAAAAVETGPQGVRGNGPGRRSCGNPAGAAPGASDRRAPYLLVALGVGPETCRENKGCIISEQGEPPDFVLEIAARRAGAVDFRMPVEAPGTGDSGPVASAGTWGPSHSENGAKRAT